MNRAPQGKAAQVLPRLCLWQVFLRSFWLQAAWNAAGMQNLGMAYALWPALRQLYPEAGARQRAIERHLATFNTHPYLAAAIVGGVLHHEERIARGEESAERSASFKALLMGPLAALGDGFFWRSLRPAFAALAVLLSLEIGVWGVLWALLFYNAIHLWVRVQLFWAGYRLGDGVIAPIARWRFSERRSPLRWLAAACLGAFAVLVVLQSPRLRTLLDGNISATEAVEAFDVSAAWMWLIGALALAVSVQILRQGKLNPYFVLLGAALLGLAAEFLV